MLRIMAAYVRYVDGTCAVVGKLSMYLVAVMIAVLMYSCIARTVFNLPLIWTVEFSQFVMSAYFMLGGAYVILLKGHVRMDLFYGKWSPKRQGTVDVVTDLCLIAYLVILFVGAVLSIDYAIEYDQRARSAWAPPLAPIKIIMGIGVLLMLLQSIATLFKDIAKARGKPLPVDGSQAAESGHAKGAAGDGKEPAHE